MIAKILHIGPAGMWERVLYYVWNRNFSQDLWEVQLVIYMFYDIGPPIHQKTPIFTPQSNIREVGRKITCLETKSQ